MRACMWLARGTTSLRTDIMKQKRAIELREAWGDAPCEHPQLAKVYDLGAHTGSYACIKCGASFSFREKAELAAARRG